MKPLYQSTKGTQDHRMKPLMLFHSKGASGSTLTTWSLSSFSWSRRKDTGFVSSKKSHSCDIPASQPYVLRVIRRPMVQLVMVVICYLFHLMVLTQNSIAFPFQLIPNEKGQFQSIGLDSLAGIGTVLAYIYARRRWPSLQLPSIGSSPSPKQSPWQFTKQSNSLTIWNNIMMRRSNQQSHNNDKTPAINNVAAATTAAGDAHSTIPNTYNTQNSTIANDNKNIDGASKDQFVPWMLLLWGPQFTSLLCFALLVQTYFWTGRFSIFWEDFLYSAAGLGYTMTIAMHRSLCVLLGHLSWVASGGLLLRLIPRPQPFFNINGGYDLHVKDDDSEDDNSVDRHDAKTQDNSNGEDAILPIKQERRKNRWFTNQWNSFWLPWVVGGYYVSAWLFNIADFINQSVLPQWVFEDAAEGVVSQLINPENNDLLASMVGCIAPCITAPWWEEVLYRGFLLPAMSLLMGFRWAVFTTGVIFSAHHMSITGAIPLAFLGWAWAVLYSKSGNLMVTIIVHALWNSRVFLGNWLGL